MRLLPVALVAIAGVAAVAGVAAPARAATTTAIAVQSPDPARWVVADDGRLHIQYDLVVSNAFVSDVRLESLTVTAGKRTVLRLGGDALVAATQRILDDRPVESISPSGTAVLLVDVSLPRGRRLPKHVTNRITYSIPPNPANAIIGTRTWRGPRLPVVQERPIVIAPPLRGAGWFNGNGCCAPDSRHRNLLLAGDGRWVIPEAFDVDWVQLVDEKLYTGDGLQLSDYPGYGAKLYAVADGRVVSVQDDRPEAPLGGLRNPGIEKPADYGGNQVVIRIAPRKYAVYAHLIAKRIPVRVGQRVREGQVVGLLGNTGNSSAPHLHFGIHDSPAEATGTSLPFVIDRYRYEGSSELTDGADYPIAGAPHAERRTYPLLLSVATFR